MCLTKYCSCTGSSKASSREKHNSNCRKNYDGTSGCMVVAAAKHFFERSHSRGVRCVIYLGDGDSNAFGAVDESRP